MIKVEDKGSYKLIETRQQIKILYLDGAAYVWFFVPGIGSVLEATSRTHQTEHVLARGNYRIYNVKDEVDFSNRQHLELYVGEGRWQGYLLLSGLPSASRKRTKLIATGQAISLRKD